MSLKIDDSEYYETKGMCFDYAEDKENCSTGFEVNLKDKDNINAFMRAWLSDEGGFGLYRVIRKRYDDSLDVLIPTACFKEGERVQGGVPSSFSKLLKVAIDQRDKMEDKYFNNDKPENPYIPYVCDHYYRGCYDVFEWLVDTLKVMGVDANE